MDKDTENKTIEGFGNDSYYFNPDGRSQADIQTMRRIGYVEMDAFQSQCQRTDGYFCGSCEYFSSRPNTLPKFSSRADGRCLKYDFPDRDYGCCNGWEPNFLEHTDDK